MLRAQSAALAAERSEANLTGHFLLDPISNSSEAMRSAMASSNRAGWHARAGPAATIRRRERARSGRRARRCRNLSGQGRVGLAHAAGPTIPRLMPLHLPRSGRRQVGEAGLAVRIRRNSSLARYSVAETQSGCTPPVQGILALQEALLGLCRKCSGVALEPHRQLQLPDPVRRESPPPMPGGDRGLPPGGGGQDALERPPRSLCCWPQAQWHPQPPQRSPYCAGYSADAAESTAAIRPRTSA